MQLHLENVLGMKEEEKETVFWASKCRSASATGWREALGTVGGWRGREPLALCQDGQQAASAGACLRPPRRSQSASSCSGHSLLTIEMFAWAKFPPRMLRDGRLCGALAAAHRRLAFAYSSLQLFTFPFVDLFQRTTKGRV